MGIDMDALLGDLVAETEVVVAMLADLEDSAWDTPTPAPGWTIRDQVSHLAYFDEGALLALKDPDQFKLDATALLVYGDSFPDEIAKRYRDVAPEKLLAWFKAARAGLIASFAGVEGRHRLAWYGPDMSAASSLTARLMETWAHGVDIADALGIAIVGSKRLRHIAHLGYSTRRFSYTLRNRQASEVPLRVELLAPDGSTWNFGPEGASEVVSASALEFCLIVTQRRNLADTQVQMTGPIASEWMLIAQAYAGAPGPGRQPKSLAGKREGSQ
jgi:uncharacterized protein (TIGR03084 family)